MYIPQKHRKAIVYWFHCSRFGGLRGIHKTNSGAIYQRLCGLRPSKHSGPNARHPQLREALVVGEYHHTLHLLSVSVNLLHPRMTSSPVCSCNRQHPTPHWLASVDMTKSPGPVGTDNVSCTASSVFTCSNAACCSGPHVSSVFFLS
eukprot:Filipodium_phascolosomae@DN8164_c0_g1_i1.p1